MVDIHRNDGLSTMVGGSPASPPAALPPGVYGNATTDVGFGGLGTVSVASPPGGVSSVEPGYALNTSNRSTTYVGGRSVPASTVSMEMEPEAEPISLGPLVSRSAAPIGPALATSVDDPAPSISRDEQGGRELDLVRLKGEAGDLESELRIGEANGRASGRRLGEGGGSPLIALMAPGGLPSLVASFPGGSDRSQAEALAATLQPPADLADAGRRLPNSPDDWSRQQEDVARAGVASRAVGFVVALGLASGPLYPDLIAFARRRLTRRRVSAGPLIRRRFRGSIV